MQFLLRKTLSLFKIDIHTHILPNNLNELTDTFSDPRYLSIEMLDDQNALLNQNQKPFRKVSCNCWNVHERIKDFRNSNVDLQVLSTIPILFSYWARDAECLKLSQFLNDHISNIVQKYPNSESILRRYGLYCFGCSNAIKEDIKLMLYNNRNMIIESKKLLK